VINKKKKEQDNINKQVSNEILSNNLSIADHRKDLHKSTIYDEDPNHGFTNLEETEHFLTEDDDLIPSIIKILEETPEDIKPIIHYPSTKLISMEEYNELLPYLKTANIVRDN
jgi:hypothetical protein